VPNAQTTPKPKRRPWFQIHLSSAVVLILLSGAILGVNVYFISNSPFFDGTYYHSYVCGWPIKYEMSGMGAIKTNLRAPVFNLLIAFTTLVLTGTACERFTRRSGAQDPEPESP